MATTRKPIEASVINELLAKSVNVYEEGGVELENAVGAVFSREITKSVNKQNGTNPDGSKKFEIVKTKSMIVLVVKALVPLFQRLQQTVKPAPGIVFESYRGMYDATGEELMFYKTLPIQYGAFAGGQHLDLVHPPKADGTANLGLLMRWGFDRQTGKNAPPTYDNGCDTAIADFLLMAAGTVLDSAEGRDFRAELLSEEMIAKASEGRIDTPGFRRSMAVTGDHWATVRRSDSPDSYREVNHERTEARQVGSASRTVADALPF